MGQTWFRRERLLAAQCTVLSSLFLRDTDRLCCVRFYVIEIKNTSAGSSPVPDVKTRSQTLNGLEKAKTPKYHDYLKPPF